SLLLLFEPTILAHSRSHKEAARTVVNVNRAAQGDQDTYLLELGKPIKREIVAGGIHFYRLDLSSNQFVRVAVAQHGIDVTVRLFNPDGEHISEANNGNGIQGLKLLAAVSDAAGNYRLEVRSPEKMESTGSYELKIEERRPATPQDRSYIAAQRYFAVGQQLLAEGTVLSKHKALESFARALPLWESLGDRRAQAVTLSNIAKIYDSSGDKQNALGYHNQVLLILRGVGDRRSEAATLNNIGLIYDSIGEKQKALDYYNQALPILRSVGERLMEAYTLSNIGLVYDSMGEKQKALDYYNQALPILQSVGDRQAESVTLNNIGMVYKSLNALQKALDYFGKALPIMRAVNARGLEATTLNNIGYVYDALGERNKALLYYNQALPVLQVVGDRRVEATTLNNIGVVYASLGEKQKALGYFNQALQLRRTIVDRAGEATTLSDLRCVYDSLGEQQKALDYYSQALSLSRAVEDPSVEALTLRRLAQAYGNRGDLVTARKHIEAALAIVESLRTNVFSQELRASYFASAQQYFETYIDLLMRLHQLDPAKGYDATALQAGERARARSLLEMLTESRADVHQGMDSALLGRRRSLQQTLAARAERQTRLMGGEQTEVQIAELKKEIEELLTQHQEVEAQIKARSPRYAALTQPKPLSLKEIQQHVLDSETLLLEYALGDTRSYLWAVTPTSIKSFELPRRAEIEKAARHVYELLTARNRRVKFETVEEKQARVAQADGLYWKEAGVLSEMLLKPVSAELGKKRLLVVSDGALNYVPFSALPKPVDGSEQSNERKRKWSPSAHQWPLMLDHEVVNLPSVSTLAVLRRELIGRKPAAKILAVIADPVFDKTDERVKALKPVRKVDFRNSRSGEASEATGLGYTGGVRSARVQSIADEAGPIQRLPFTRREAEGILSLVPESERMKALDFDANRTTVTGAELGQY
nr:tetratricopeptide repeat protein [Pyrinomonadaceae bacterium]